MSDKQSTLKKLDEEYQNLRALIEGLDDEAQSRVWFDRWSVKDIIAHIAGWEREMTGALERMARGERPTPEGVDYSDSDAWNAKFSAGAHVVAANTLMARWQQTHATYARAASALPEDRFGEQDGKLKTANRLIETSGYGHFREHGAQIAEWRKREGL